MNKARWVALSWYVGPALWAHKGRHIAALFAVAAGIALAVAIHTVNQSAISEFQAATAKINGNAQLQIRGNLKTFNEATYPLVATWPGVAQASPVLEVDTLLVKPATALVNNSQAQQQTKPSRIRLIGIDLFRAALVTPALLPKLANNAAQSESPTAIFSEDAVFTAASYVGDAHSMIVQGPVGVIKLSIKGTVALTDANSAVMDIASMQQNFGLLGQLSRIDLSLLDGVNVTSLQTQLQAALPPDVRVVLPSEEAQRASNMSRAYRVNLTVLAMVALVSGGMIVFSALGAGVLQQWPHIALISLLGASRRFVMATVLIQGIFLGTIGTLFGLILGYGLAAVLLYSIGSDLGGGYFSGKPTWPSIGYTDLALFSLLGITCGILAAWLPARSALAARSADALKPGHGERSLGAMPSVKPAVVIGALGLALAFAPAINELPLAGYAAIACWLFAGVAAVPWLVSNSLAWLAKTLGNQIWRFPSLWLALHRTGQSPGLAINAIAAVVASLALVTAMTVMVSSFRGSVTQWLDQILPADLYARLPASNLAGFTTEDQAKLSALPIIARAEFLRVFDVNLNNQRAAVSVLVRNIDHQTPTTVLPIIGNTMKVNSQAANALPRIYISEACATLFDLTIGKTLALPLGERTHQVLVAGIWRDYARQTGAISMDKRDYQLMTGDTTANDAALWIKQGVDQIQINSALTNLQFGGRTLEWRSAKEIRDLSLTIFDRSFAVTYALEAAAIIVALIGVAASFGAQALSRQKEFAVLAHLGGSRQLMDRQLALEGGLLTLGGSVWGACVGLLMSLVLIHRVNPQSFYWTMDLTIHWMPIVLGISVVSLCAALCALWAGRRALAGGVLHSVRQDW